MKFQTSNLLQKHQRNVHGMSGGGSNNQSGAQNGISLNNNSIQLINPSPVVQRHQVVNMQNLEHVLTDGVDFEQRQHAGHPGPEQHAHD